MIKMFCDRCGRELDNENMKYVGLSINDYEDGNVDPEHWDFCHECASSIRYGMIVNIAEYEKHGLKR